MVKLHAGNLVQSAVTLDCNPRLANAPLNIPDGNTAYFSASFATFGPDKCFNQLNLLSTNTKTPLFFSNINKIIKIN